MTTQNDTTTEAPDYKDKPTTEEIERVFGDAIDDTLGDRWPHQDVAIATLEDAGYGRDEIVKGVRVAAGGVWETDDGTQHADEASVFLASAREALKYADIDVVEGAEEKRALQDVVQAVHDAKSSKVLGDDDPSGYTDVCVVLHD